MILPVYIRAIITILYVILASSSVAQHLTSLSFLIWKNVAFFHSVVSSNSLQLTFNQCLYRYKTRYRKSFRVSAPKVYLLLVNAYIFTGHVTENHFTYGHYKVNVYIVTENVTENNFELQDHKSTCFHSMPFIYPKPYLPCLYLWIADILDMRDFFVYLK